MPDPHPDRTPLHLRGGGTSVVLDLGDGAGLPRVLHWGADLGDLGPADLDALALASVPPVASGTPDAPTDLTVLPEQQAGWQGTPGLSGHRAGRAFSPALRRRAVEVAGPGEVDGVPVAATVTVDAEDPDADLRVRWRLELLRDGLLRTRATLTSTGEGIFDLHSLDVVLPVPREAAEILDFTGRHLKERTAQRHAFTAGTHLRESRRARALDGTGLLVVGEPGFRHRVGAVHAVHVAWSGNTRTFAEQEMPGGRRVIGGGELLLPGEIRLGRDEGYTSPWVYAGHGDGLDALSARFHAFLRSRPTHPRRARPTTINVWEAVYFDHDLDRLRALADRAAQVGLERYVLDDGWFRHRRDDTAGLGDWYVDEDVWPAGLHPLVDHVTGLGLEFGLWFEPEMVNEDSDLAREHPDWVLRTPHRMPRPSRHQQVLDLTVPAAWQHVHDRMHALLSEYRIGYLKWDHNRDLLDAGRQATGTAGVHEQTRAAYRLMAALRAAHPGVEIESCASGGGRVDLGILEHTDRVWTSDCIDPLERQTIQAGTGLLVPPELLGAHIASPHSHTTGRRHDLSFRAATALFGHLGVEWDLTAASAQDLEDLARWVALHRAHRDLLHHGDVVRGDDPDPALRVHGVVAHDRREAVLALVQQTTSTVAPVGRVRLPGLDPDLRYRVQPLAPGDDPGRTGPAEVPGWWADGVVLPGRVLADVGVQAPQQLPEHTVLLHLRAV